MAAIRTAAALPVFLAALAAAGAARGAEAEAAEARKAVEAASRTVTDVLGCKREGLKVPVKELVQGALAAKAADPNFYSENAQAIAATVKGDAGRKGTLDAARKRLVGFGLLKDGADGSLDLTPIRGGAGPASDWVSRHLVTTCY
jgi:hypothetical protein